MDIEHLNYELKKREDLILEEHSVGKSCPLKCGSLEDTCMHAAPSCYVTFSHTLVTTQERHAVTYLSAQTIMYIHHVHMPK